MVGFLFGFGRARNVDSWRWAVRRGGIGRVVALGEGGVKIHHDPGEAKRVTLLDIGGNRTEHEGGVAGSGDDEG